MKTIIWRGLILTMFAFLLMGFSSCQGANSGVTITEGPVAAELGKAKDEQIKGLTQQVIQEREKAALERQQASLAAANFDGILFAAEHVEIGLPRNAIEEEAKLGKARSPAPDPQEVIKAKDRVIAILQNEVAKAKELYGKAFNEAAQAKAQIAEKDRVIALKDVELDKRGQKISDLEVAKMAEFEKHKGDIKAALDAKDKIMADYKKAEAEKERRWLINASRIAALGLIVAGAIALAVFKMIAVGGGLAAAGVLVGLISVGIETLTSQSWWPYLCGGVFLSIVVAGLVGLYQLWVKHQLSDKKAQAIQDMIDEATAKGDTKAVEELKSNLAYRIGDKNSFWGKKQAAEVIKLGLVNPAGEKAIKGAVPVSPRE